ncbi:MAG: PaaI family thioesterase [Bacteroidota bacterium]
MEHPSSKPISPFFQDHMPENVCFGCGQNNHEGLQIKSNWEAELSICEWMPETKHHGWPNLLNGGIIATLIDCHCMCTAMANAYRNENRGLYSQPEYRYATGSMQIKYLKPTSNNHLVRLEAKVIEVKNRKTVLDCTVYSQGVKTVEAQVIALRVFDSSQAMDDSNPFNA